MQPRLAPIPRRIAGGRIAALFGACLAANAFLAASVCAQEPSLEGDWRAGSVSVRVEVTSWGPDCGPRPMSSQRAGGAVSIKPISGGSDLVLTGAVELSTARCWSDNPTLQRLSSQRSADQWKMTCRTSDRDARAEHGIYDLRVRDSDTLERRSVSRYDWQLNASQCKAVVTETQRLSRVRTTPTDETERESEPGDTPCTPGTAQRIRITPRSAQLQPGESLRLRARVLDAAGCDVSSAIDWRLYGPDAARATLRDGIFETPASAAEAEGRFEVTAQVGSVRETSRITVRSIDLSDLIAERGEPLRPPAATASRGRAAGISAESHSDDEGRGLGWLLGLGALAVVCALGFMLRQQRRMARELMAEPLSPLGAPALAHEPSAEFIRTDGSRTTNATDARQTRRARPEDRAERPVGRPAEDVLVSTTPLICPECRRGYAGPETQCPTDGTALVPYDQYRALHEGEARSQVRKCPTCGDAYPADRQFCGKDGAPLNSPE